MLYIAFCALYLGTFTYCIFLKASCKRKVKSLFGSKRLKGKQIVVSFTTYQCFTKYIMGPMFKQVNLYILKIVGHI